MELGTFAPLLLTEFTLGGPTGSAGDVVLLLTDVTRLEAQPGAPRPEPFALEFVGPRGSRLEQGTYVMRHASLGEVEMFIVPIGYADGGAIRYEAVFN